MPTQLTWAQQKLCTTSDVYRRISTLEVILQTNKDKKTLENDIKNYIGEAKTFIRADILKKLQKRVPEKINRWLTQRRADLVEWKATMQRNAELNNASLASLNSGYLGWSGEFFDLEDFQIGFGPNIFWNSGIPVSGNAAQGGTLVGEATNGAIIIETTTNREFINHSTDPLIVTWDLWSIKDALDWVQEIAELNICAVTKSIILMASGGLFSNKDHSAEDRDFMRKQIKDWECEYRNQFDTGFSLIDFDITHDGLINDWEKGITSGERVLFG